MNKVLVVYDDDFIQTERSRRIASLKTRCRWMAEDAQLIMYINGDGDVRVLKNTGNQFSVTRAMDGAWR